MSWQPEKVNYDIKDVTRTIEQVLNPNRIYLYSQFGMVGKRCRFKG